MANEFKFSRLILAGWLPLLRSAFDQIGRRGLYYRMSLSVFLLMLASWVGYFWLGYQLERAAPILAASKIMRTWNGDIKF